MLIQFTSCFVVSQYVVVLRFCVFRYLVCLRVPHVSSCLLCCVGRVVLGLFGSRVCCLFLCLTPVVYATCFLLCLFILFGIRSSLIARCSFFVLLLSLCLVWLIAWCVCDSSCSSRFFFVVGLCLSVSVGAVCYPYPRSGRCFQIVYVCCLCYLFAVIALVVVFVVVSVCFCVCSSGSSFFLSTPPPAYMSRTEQTHEQK